VDTAVLGAEALDAFLSTALTQRPGAVLVALSEGGMMVALPAVDMLAGYPSIEVPTESTSFMALFIAADRMAVLGAWERGREGGVGRCSAHLLETPAQAVTLLFGDTRQHLGVRLCLMTTEEPDDSPQGEPVGGEPARSLNRLAPRIALLQKNMYGFLTTIDERASRMLGWSAEEMIGHRSLHFLHPDDHDRAIANWLEFVSVRRPARIRVRHRTKGGDWLWVEVEHTYQHHDDPDQARVNAQISDISDEMAAHEAVTQREKLFRRVTESLPLGLFLVHADRSVGYANTRLAAILGVPSATTLDEQFATVTATDRPNLDAAFTLTMEEGLDQQLEVGLTLPDDGRRAVVSQRRCSLTLAALSDEEGSRGVIITVADVTAAARMREELRVRATFDALTGCHNRASVMTALEQAVTEVDASLLAVVFIDLDKFKPVNDLLGHAAGDELLVHTAQVLNAQVRDVDLVARIGGDEFLLIYRGVRDRREAQQIGTRVQKALDHDVTVTGGTVRLQASVGIAQWEPGLSADALIARADTSMYEAKRLGHTAAILYTDGMIASGPMWG
jgi:diguanylate cyclase (GGDEF)-like protein/PAS domain S-box-containing protein